MLHQSTYIQPLDIHFRQESPMRTALITLCALALCAIVAFSQQSEVATISPQNPKVGDRITLTYDGSARSAVLRDPPSMIAEVMVLRADDDPIVLEPPMKRSGSLWKASFSLKQGGAQLILFRFRAGQRLDDNGENTWRSLVYGQDDRPVEGAYVASATFHQYPNFRGFKSQKNPDAASAALREERNLYPNNWRAVIAGWQFMGRSAMSDEGKTVIHKELDDLYAAHKTDEEAVAQIVTWYERTGQKETAESIRGPIIAENSTGKVAEAAKQALIYQERDPAKRVQLIEDFLKEFPQTGSTLENLQMQLFVYSTRANDNERAVAILATMNRPSGQMYNSLAWPLIEKGENLIQAVAWAKKGLDLLDPSDISDKPPYITTTDWKQTKKYGRAMVLDTYGYGLMKLGRLAEAHRAFDEALRLTEYKDPEINERATECLVKDRKYKKATEVSLVSIRSGRSNEKLLAHYKTAYVAVHGSEVGYQESIDGAKAAAKRALAEKILKERINKPAIDFALKSLDGSVVRLSDLRGKIVVIDFWATWAGPCIQSFPTLQMVYDKYKNDNDIVILAVNTWESKAGQDLVDHVKDFIAKKQYTFPVLFDEGFVEKYGVEGIPTKFIIDQKGIIQFKDIGFGGEDEMTQKMEMQFELLRKEAL
jgi:thiol-disulfide isomerase/thioredoxin